MKKLLGVLSLAALFLHGGAALAETPAISSASGSAAPISIEALLFQSDFKSATPPVPGSSLVTPPVLTLLAAVEDLFSLHGDLVVLQGDDTTVSDLGNGSWGLRLDDTAQNPLVITEKFIARYGDHFDFVVVWTAFRDRGADGLAYYIGVANETLGIGVDVSNTRQFWGVPTNGRLQGFLNMKSIQLYGDIDDPANFVYPVMGQEITHRWLASMQFERDSGVVSEAMLGRDGSHWSSLLHAEASVQDGNSWRDNDDGTFSVTETNARFSPLDLYGMGLYAPSEVPDWFLIENATYQQQGIAGTSVLPVGLTVSGTRTDISIDDVIAAEGPRVPNTTDQQKQFRIAYILVTAPDQTIDDVANQIPLVQTFIQQWETLFSEWTMGRASLCARISADCETGVLQLVSQSYRELHGDGDGVAEPGETVAISLTVYNPGTTPAEAPRAHLKMPEDLDISLLATPIVFAPVAPGETVALDDIFELTLGPDAPCGVTQSFLLEMATGAILTTGQVKLPIGIRALFEDSFETDKGWLVNAEGADSASLGAWERAKPEAVAIFGTRLSQPGSGVDDDFAFVTGALAGSASGDFDLDDGVTTLTSPIIDIADAYDPVLSYASWHIAYDFNAGGHGLQSDPNDPLVVQISTDGGARWIDVEADTNNTREWGTKSWRLLDILTELPPTLRVRFIAQDMPPQSLSEAAIDRVRVEDLETTCFGEPWVEPIEPVEPIEVVEPNPVRGGKSDGCEASGSGGGALTLLLAAFLALTMRRRRRDPYSAR